jgi:dihydroxy-acid dehydratase
LTVTENNSRFITVPDLNDGQDVIHKIQKALKVQEISKILYGNLATEGCVQKLVAMKGNILKVMPLFMKMNTK